jgi:hypothetical protein
VVSNKAFAKEVTDLLLQYSDRLDGSVAHAKDVCSQAEFEAYRRAVGEVMGAIWDQVLGPIFKEHPDLKPKEVA